MKNNVSSKFPILRKDIFRFAPLWGIYFVGMLLIMMSTLDSFYDGRSAVALVQTMSSFAVVNLIYAALVAMMLFGDLYNTRLCYALHALPMRREKWFMTHVASGVLYSLVPNLVAAVAFVSLLGKYWFVAGVWLLAVTLQYLFFFGLAVLAALLCGNRFAALATYAIVNSLSMIFGWFVNTVYIPFLHGIVAPYSLFSLFCPVVQMAQYDELLRIDGRFDNVGFYVATYEGFGKGWGYLAICACVGLALLGAALLLYRKRKLECAGDFLAFKPLEPVFAVVFTLSVGCFFSLFGSLFLLESVVFFLVGLAVGWFGAQMLLQRTVKVFHVKSFGKLSILALALALTIGITVWDPAGITTYVPDVDRIERVEFTNGSLDDFYYQEDKLDTQDPQLIASVCKIHQYMLKNRSVQGIGREFTIRYTLDNGRQVVRSYYIYNETEVWDMAKALFTSPMQVLGFADQTSWNQADVEFQINSVELNQLCELYQNIMGSTAAQYDPQEMEQSLKDALWKDCAAGTLLPQSMTEWKDNSDYWIYMEVKNADGSFRYYSYNVVKHMEHCMQWLEDYEDVLKWSSYPVPTQ